MSDDHRRPASDGGYPMIYRPSRRIVATACLHCRLSLNACQANREYRSEPCCPTCDHD